MSSSNQCLTLEYPGFTISVPSAPGKCSFSLNGKHIHLQPLELKFLRVLAERPGEILDDHAMLEAVYGPGSGVSPKIVDVYVCKLRRVFAYHDEIPKDLIRTFHRQGIELMMPSKHSAGALAPPTVSCFTSGNAVVTRDSMGVVRVNGTVLPATPKESALLALLMSTPGKAWGKDRLMQKLYGASAIGPDLKVLDVFICKLRKKLAVAHDDLTKAIVTPWGRGPMLQDVPLAANIPAGVDTKACLHDRTFGKLTVESLHSSDARWVPRRKAIAVKLVEGGLLTVEQLLEYYPDLQREDFESWTRVLRKGEVRDLRVTRYKRAA